MLKILLLDDALERGDLALRLIQRGYVVAISSSLEDVLEKLQSLDFDWILCNQFDPNGLCSLFFSHLSAPDSEPVASRILICTSFKNIKYSSWSVREVVILTPPYSIDVLSEKLNSNINITPFQLVATEESVTPTKNDTIFYINKEPKSYKMGPNVQPFIGSCSVVQKIIRQIEKVSLSDSTVLLLGESGTGKELVTQSIHDRSPRSSKPLIPINCGAIPSELLESELFGHVKGAFSGANTSRPGRFSLADGGTLFLDEVGEMPLALQVKLLRALQEKEITPLGASKTQKIDVRIVAATNQNLEELVDKKLFREDLFYRLNVIPIYMPPLRDRIDDVPDLLIFFTKYFNEKCGSKIRGFTSEALDALTNYSWPGNIREIKNFVERLAILNEGDIIGYKDLPEKIQKERPSIHSEPQATLPDSGVNFYEAVEQFEKALILQALDKTDWNKNKAAALLEMNRTTLVEKIKKKEISRNSS